MENAAHAKTLSNTACAFTLMPVLPQEDPERVDQRTREWMDSVQPRNALERDLTAQGASLTMDIERAHRLAVGHMARRVVIAARLRTRRVPKRLRKQIEELGRRLLYIVGPEDIKVDKQPPGDDCPGLLVAELEDTAEGCRWLLERWAEYRRLLDTRAKWEEPVLIRFIRLQGKRLVESVYDPVLNSIFLAWDVIVPNYARVEWEEYREERLILDPAYNHRLQWKEIAPRPKDVSEAWAVLYAIVDEHVGRLEELLAQNEAIEAIEDPTWMDRAAMDCSAAFERHRRYQSAKTRELHKTLDTLIKMRNSEFGTEGVASGQWPVASEGEGQMTDGECQMADGRGREARGRSRCRRTAWVKLWDKIPILSLRIQQTTRLESCPTRRWKRRAERGRQRATSRA